MKLRLILLLGLLGGTALAQQDQPVATRPVVQAAGGDRPGGISFVTRRTSGIVPINNAAALFAAGGVPVIQPAAVGATGQGVLAMPATAASAPLDPRAMRALNVLAARGDRTAQQLVAAGSKPQPARAR